MALAAILGMFALLAGTPSSIATVLPAPAFLQAEQTQPQQDSPSPGTPQETPAPKEEPPTQPQPTAPAPDSAAPPVTTIPDTTPKPPEIMPEPPPAAQPPVLKRQPAKRPATKAKTVKRRKKVPATAAGASSPKVVVKNGSTSDPKIQLVPGLSKQQASQQLNNTNQLLDATDVNLKKISGQQLTTSQQETLKQIKSYMQKAKEAVGVGDVQGAHNLAFKANLLSQELAKP